MLVLTRRLEESIMIGDNIKITIVQIKGKLVRIGIEAPEQVKVFREEVYDILKTEKEIKNAEKCL